MRSRSQHEGKLECACCLRGCGNPFDSQASVVKGIIVLPGGILNCASDESNLGCQPDRFRDDFGSVAEPFSQISRNG